MKQILPPIDTNISNKTINNKNKINSNTNNDNIDSPTQYSPASVVTNIDLLTHKETLVKKINIPSYGRNLNYLYVNHRY